MPFRRPLSFGSLKNKDGKGSHPAVDQDKAALCRLRFSFFANDISAHAPCRLLSGAPRERGICRGGRSALRDIVSGSGPS